MSKKDCYTKTSADIEPKIQISADKSAITLSIHKGLNLTLKRDYERNCFVGEIPVAELLELFYGIKESAKGAVNGAGVGAGLRPTGMIIGALGKFIKDYYIEEDIKKTKIFNYTINKLNQRYGLHLTKRNSSHSDFTVEVDADRVYGLI